MIKILKPALFFILIVASQLNAQTRGGARGYEADFGMLSNANGRSVSNESDIRMYLFDNWDADAIFHMKDDKNFKAKSINYNIQKDQFECKFAKDSLFVFAHNFDYSLINGKKFKRFFIGSSPSYAEVIFENETTTFIKKYTYKVLESSPDPLMIRKDVNKVFITPTYYLIDNKSNSLQLVKLRKGSFAKFFAEKKSEMNAFVKRNNLSYKDERDIFEMLQYKASL